MYYFNKQFFESLAKSFKLLVGYILERALCGQQWLTGKV